MPATDEELMQHVRGGDRDALEELVRRYHGPLRNFAVRFLDDRDAADDVVQETFLRVLEAAPRWRATAKVSTYLHTIAANLCRDELKRARRRREEPLEEGEDGPVDPAPSPEAQALANLRAAKVRAAVQRLPPEQREAVLLHHYQGLSHPEIAQVCRCPVGTVKSRLHHAHRKLREWLADELEE
jgi:RNA polymerase sigma-70 factor (ECF subfamily)